MKGSALLPRHEREPGATPRAARVTPRQLYHLREHLTSYTMIAPFFILFAIFGLIPLIFSLYLSFHEWNMLTPMHFVGLRNYVRLLTADPLFRTALYNTAFIGLFAGVLVISGAHVLAFILNSPRLRWRESYRAAFFVPILVSSVAVGIIFSVLFATRFGLVNVFLESLGLPRVAWLGGAGYGIKPVIIILNMWRYTGWNIVLVTAGLQAIPHELFEAAEIDGASRYRIFRYVTIPLLAPTSLYILITAISGTVQMFDEAYIIAGPMGGIDNQGLTLGVYMYANAFSFMKLGYGSALGYVMAFLIFVLSYVVIRRYTRSAYNQ